jgi:hypothetical protein
VTASVRRTGVGLLAAVIAATIVLSGPPASADERPTVAFVGDSIGRDAEPEIKAQVERTNRVAYYHAIGAGYVNYHLPRLLPAIQPLSGPDIVVAELGTGDAFWSHGPARFEADMRRFLDRVTPHVQCVVWLDQKPGGNRAYPMINERAAAFNDVVHRVVRDYENVRSLHYAAWTDLAGSPGPYFLADWLHLTQAGERELARLVGTAVRGCQDDLASGPFWDVADDFWAAEDIAWAAEEGIVAGFDNGTYRATVGQFRPPVTRGQAAQMLWRLDGSPPAAQPHRWRDGAPWVRDALRWGRSARVLTGYPDGTFRPDEPVTRGQLLGWLWRAAGRPNGFPANTFPDSTAALRGPLNWAEANDVVAGVAGRFDREAPIDRAQIAAWLHATWTFQQVPPPPPPAPPPTTAPPTTAPPTTLPATTVP